MMGKKKLTDEQVIEIRKLVVEHPEAFLIDIAKEYNVSVSLISRILNGHLRQYVREE